MLCTDTNGMYSLNLIILKFKKNLTQKQILYRYIPANVIVKYF